MYGTLAEGATRQLECVSGYQPSEEYAELYCDGGTLEGATCDQIPTVGSSNIKDGYYALGKQAVCQSFAKEQLCKLDGSDQTACADSTYPEGYLKWVDYLAAVAAGMITSDADNGCGVHDPTTCEQSGDCLYGTNNAKCVIKPSWVRSVLDGEGAMIWIATAYENGHAWCGTGWAMDEEACDALGNACTYLPDQGGCQKNYLAMVVNLADACSDHVSSADLDAIADFRGFTNVADAREACGEDCPIIEEPPGAPAGMCCAVYFNGELTNVEGSQNMCENQLNGEFVHRLSIGRESENLFDCVSFMFPSLEACQGANDETTVTLNWIMSGCDRGSGDHHDSGDSIAPPPGPDGVHEEPSSWDDDGVDKAPEGGCCAALYYSELDPKEGTKEVYEEMCATGLNGAFSFRRSIGYWSLAEDQFDCVSFRFADMDACKSANPHDADDLLWISEKCEKEAPAAYVPPTNDVVCAEWATESVCYSKETEDECALAGQSCKWNPGQGCWLDEGAKLYSLWYRPFGLENFGDAESECFGNNALACADKELCTYRVNFARCSPAEERAIATLSDDGVTSALAKYFSLYSHPCFAHADEDSCSADAEKNGCTDRRVVEGVHPDGKSKGDFSHCKPKQSIWGAEAVNACVGTDVDFTAVGEALGFGSLDQLFADAGVERVYPSPPPLSAAEQDRIKAQEAEEAAAAARAAREAAEAEAEAKEALDREMEDFLVEVEKLDPDLAGKLEMLAKAAVSGKTVPKMAASGVSAASDDDACDQVTAKLPDPECECAFCVASAASRRRRRSALQTSYDVEVLVDPDEVSAEEVSAAAEAMSRDLPGVTVDTSDADATAEISSAATAVDGDATWVTQFADLATTYAEASATAAELASTAETLESIADEAAAALIFPPPPFAPPPPPSPPPRALIWDDEDAAPPGGAPRARRRRRRASPPPRSYSRDEHGDGPTTTSEEGKKSRRLACVRRSEEADERI